jgi:uncharacterized protein (DUF305 family)
MGQWRKAWYPVAPVERLTLRTGGFPHCLSGLMMAIGPTQDFRGTWFLEGMIAYHGGSFVMAHDALEKSSNPTLRRLARQITWAQRLEIMTL